MNTGLYDAARADVTTSAWAWLILAIIFFIAIREVCTWYWKINEGIELLRKIEENTRKEKVKEIVPTK